MTPNPELGNRIILLSVAIFFAVASLFVQWGTIKLTADDLRNSMTINGQRVGMESMEGMFSGMMSSMMTGMSVPLTGQDGSVSLGPITIPWWLAIGGVVFGLVVTITNATGISDVPRKIIHSLFGVGLVVGLWAVVVMLVRGSIGLGALMLIGAATIGILQEQKQHRSEPHHI